MTPSAAVKEKYFRRQALYWLVLAGAILLAWVILWLASSAPKIIQDKAAEEKSAEQTELPTSIKSLGELNKEVAPIDFATLVRDLRTYPAEFKDKNYFSAKSFTIEIMNVAQNEIIVNYLNSRPNDREKFAYFRYLDENENPRYILTYGKFDSMELARTTAQTMNFDLPSSVMPTATAMADYLKIIDDYERGQAVRDLSSRQPRQVKLQATRAEIPVQAATPADEVLAKQSQAQLEEKAEQIQSSAEDTARVITAKPNEPSEKKEGEAKENHKTKAEPETPAAPPAKVEQAPEAPKAAPAPAVNTSKTPGSDTNQQ